MHRKRMATDPEYRERHKAATRERKNARELERRATPGISRAPRRLASASAMPLTPISRAPQGGGPQARSRASTASAM